MDTKSFIEANKVLALLILKILPNKDMLILKRLIIDNADVKTIAEELGISIQRLQKIIKRNMFMLQHYTNNVEDYKQILTSLGQPLLQEVLSIKLYTIDLSSRTITLLHQHDIDTIKDLFEVWKNQNLNTIRNFGEICMREVSHVVNWKYPKEYQEYLKTSIND